MTDPHIVQRRLRTQRLTDAGFGSAPEVVAWLGAVQAQDYGGAKWALGLRAAGLTDAGIDDAFNAGEILRTHVMRPTWHFVAPDDIRWLLGLTAPRVHTFCGSYYRKLGLDAAAFAKSRRVFERALRDQNYQTRLQLQAALKKAGIEAAGVSLAFFVMHAELEQLICSGPLRGKQFTYGLIDERAPTARRLNRDEALAELTRRYFTSHGPATARDFSWWSGLTMAEAKRGLEIAGASLRREQIETLSYWCSADGSTTDRGRSGARAYLLPNYDEALIAYKDRGPAAPSGPQGVGRDVFSYHVLVDERIAGSWRRTVKKTTATLDITLHEKPSRDIERALAASARRYGQFIGRPTTTSFQTRRR